jgi:hypothetical protein
MSELPREDAAMTQSEGDRTRKPLTPRQAEWLEAVRGFYAQHGTAPTSRDLSEAMGLNCNTSALYALHILAKKGYLVSIPTAGGHSRFIPPDRPGGGAATVRSPRTARAAAQLRRQAADMRKRADELERLAAELEGE